MKPSQKLVVMIETVTLTVRFDELDSKLLPLVRALEAQGDKFGPASGTIEYPGGVLFASIRYADKSRGPVKPQLFGEDADSLLARQYR